MRLSINGRRNGHVQPGAPPLEFREATFAYNEEPAVENVSFAVAPGEFAAILGPNGSGKTTLLRLALGLLKPDGGAVRLFGQPPESFRAWNLVGYVPQTVEGMHNRFPATVEEVVGYGLYRGFDPLGVLRSAGRPIVRTALEMAGIMHLRKRRISSLSVGQQQRMLIARALVSDPKLLLLDEPVAGVDAPGQQQFHALLRQLNHERGITVVLVSHDIGAVMREATMCACVNRTMVFHGPMHKVSSKELSELYGFPVDVLMHDALHEHR